MYVIMISKNLHIFDYIYLKQVIEFGCAYDIKTDNTGKKIMVLNGFSVRNFTVTKSTCKLPIMVIFNL